MLKKIFMTLMTAALFTTQSYAASQSGLKAAFDEFNYTMTVDGAASDKAMAEAAVNQLGQSIQSLQAQGLTNAELVEFAISQIQDKKVAQDMKAAYSQIALSKLGAEEGLGLVKSIASKGYARGASWEGDVTMIVVGGLILAAVVALALVASAHCNQGGYADYNGCGGTVTDFVPAYDYYYYDSYYY